MRKYKSGSIWALWRWSEVDSDYLTRLHVIKTPWFAICVHWIKKPDPEPYLHDHPVTFLALILRGSYDEWRTRSYAEHGPYLRTHRWFNWITASEGDRHTICRVDPNTVTLCFMGPKKRDWGYHPNVGFSGRTTTRLNAPGCNCEASSHDLHFGHPSRHPRLQGRISRGLLEQE